jgi:hypothetical protein
VESGPVNYVDPNGELKVTPKDQDAYEAARTYLEGSKAGRKQFKKLDKLDGRPNEPTLATNSNHDTRYDADTNTIHWDPTSGLDVAGPGGKPDKSGGTVQSPALGLFGEIVHANRGARDPDDQKRDGEIPALGTGGSKENMRKVNEETKAAGQLDEPTRARYIGKDSQGTNIPKETRVQCPTCKQ